MLFILIFGSRFILEFWKETLESIMDPSFLQIGQVLSLPFIIIGILLILRSKRTANSFL